MGPEWTDPKTIQHWPGRLGHELRNKVDTVVSYDLETSALSSWGFLSNVEDERFEHNEFFKIYLDPTYKDSNEDAPTTAEAQKWYEDYLRCIYRCIIRFFSDTLARFSDKRIE